MALSLIDSLSSSESDPEISRSHFPRPGREMPVGRESPFPDSTAPNRESGSRRGRRAGGLRFQLVPHLGISAGSCSPRGLEGRLDCKAGSAAGLPEGMLAIGRKQEGPRCTRQTYIYIQLASETFGTSKRDRMVSLLVVPVGPGQAWPRHTSGPASACR